MHHPNRQTLLIGSSAGVLTAALVTAGIFTGRNVLNRRRKAKEMTDENLEINLKYPSNMEYLVSHNAQGF